MLPAVAATAPTPAPAPASPGDALAPAAGADDDPGVLLIFPQSGGAGTATGDARRIDLAGGGARGERPWLVKVMLGLLYAIIAVICLYIARHYAFTLNRLHGVQRHPYLDIDTAAWPAVTVLIPAHNEEKVISAILNALLEVDYPAGKLHILPIDDRSRDRTGEIVDAFAASHPDRVRPFHRRSRPGGKAAALRDAMELVETEIALVFDADYIPGRGLIKQLVAPFFDPEVGAVMGRVVPHNVDENLLTRLLDLERSGGYQVDQQARMNLGLVPQYGGTVGGVRKGALVHAGGWRSDTLAEDTDATFRLLRRGWKTVYQNRSECYEQVPSAWPVRLRQVLRWARGHNQALAAHGLPLLLNRRTSLRERLDGFALLNVYLMSPILLLGWLLGVVLWYLGETRPGLIVILAVTSYSTVGNFATFFEVTAAAYLDGSRERIRLLPFVLLGFLVSLLAVTADSFLQLLPRWRREVRWHRTEHADNFNGEENGWE